MTVFERVTKFLTQRRAQAYWVGGTVRDQLLARSGPRDLDIALAGDAINLARAFADTEHGAFYLMDAEHNVARVILADSYVDFAALRGPLEDDLSTRDFTVNAMARPVGGVEIVDPFGGQRDLAARRIRALSATVFHQDPVRLLRAVRIAAELEFQIDPQTERWMQDAAPFLDHAAMERARDELFRILALDNAAELLRQLDSYDFLPHILPEVAGLKTVTQSAPHIFDAFEHSIHTVSELVAIQSAEYSDIANGAYTSQIRLHFSKLVSADRSRGLVLRLTALLHDIGKAGTRSVGADGRIHFYGHEESGANLVDPILRRLRMSRDEIDLVTEVIGEHLRPAQLARATDVSARAFYRFFRSLGDKGIDVCVLALADSRAKDTSGVSRHSDDDLRSMITQLLDYNYGSPTVDEKSSPLVDGRTLMSALGLESGPIVGKLLEEIREARAVGEVVTRDEAISFARRSLERQVKTD